MYVNTHNTVNTVNITNFFCSFSSEEGTSDLEMNEFANLFITMGSESCSLNIDPERTLTMIEDVYDCSDSVDNEQLMSLKETFDIHLDAPPSINGLEILVHVCENRKKRSYTHYDSRKKG